MFCTVVRVRTLKTRLHAQNCEDRPRKLLAETACKEGARGGRSRSRRFDLVALVALSLSLSLSLSVCLSLSIYSAPETGAEDDLGQLGFARRARRRAAPLVEGLVALRFSLLPPAEARALSRCAFRFCPLLRPPAPAPTARPGAAAPALCQRRAAQRPEQRGAPRHRQSRARSRARAAVARSIFFLFFSLALHCRR